MLELLFEMCSNKTPISIKERYIEENINIWACEGFSQVATHMYPTIKPASFQTAAQVLLRDPEVNWKRGLTK